jgi:diadenosine tetraphosphate (Ap4A) HIT family hydrolase
MQIYVIWFFCFQLFFWDGQTFSFQLDPVGMDIIKKGVTYDAVTGAVKSCLFCRIATREEPGTIVFEDAQFVVFKTIAPASSQHLLVTPRKHIRNLKSLHGPKDAALIREMIEVGRTALGGDAKGAHFSFHVPPYNSIDHLHLHAIGMDIK